MDYVKLGSTGMQVSKICLGCMSYGVPDRGAHPWSFDEDASRPFFRQAIEAGINFFDTANVYSDGTSEEITGRACSPSSARRDELVIATKVRGRMHAGPNGEGLSRKAIFAQLDHSLRRLGTDYVDLYQIHRWDHRTPIAETMEALHDVVKAGKVRYIGASSMYAWQFSKAQYTARLNGWTPFVTMQNHYNLLLPRGGAGDAPVVRRPRCRRHPVEPAGSRQADPRLGRHDRPQRDRRVRPCALRRRRPGDRRCRRPCRREARGVSRAQVALAWVSRHPTVAAPIVGATKPEHIDDAVASLAITLTDDEVKELEAPYTPRAIVGFV